MLCLCVGQSYSGESAGGRPLIFHLRDPSFPSQHRNRLDLSTALQGPLQGPLQSHSADVHGPKHITPVTAAKVKLQTHFLLSILHYNLLNALNYYSKKTLNIHNCFITLMITHHKSIYNAKYHHFVHLLDTYLLTY